MKNHKEINESLVDFALGQLSEQQELAVKTHLEQCQQCKCELRRLKALLEHTEQIRASSASPQMCRSAKQAIRAAVESKEMEPTAGSNVSLEFIWRTIMRSRITQIAAAAVIIIATGFFVIHRDSNETIDSHRALELSRSPVEMMTVASLNIAYRRGGMDAVEEQCDKVCEMLGTQPADISLEELMAGFNGI
jgi:anti-sigma-K factor RskA